MNVDLFDFDLPEERIALKRALPARLALLADRTGRCVVRQKSR